MVRQLHGKLPHTDCTHWVHYAMKPKEVVTVVLLLLLSMMMMMMEVVVVVVSVCSP